MIDIALLLGGLLIGGILRLCGAGRAAETRFSRMANRMTPAILICAGLAMIPRLALLPWIPAPVPKVHDEFSYILGAQTLAAGRLTNPTPPFWRHFESYHINMVPTYQSMYPPAASLFYAAGLLVGRDPWWGVWLATGLMCAAVCWALQPLIRPRGAFLAGIFCALKYGMCTLYSDSFWGGSVTALGGALALGALVRLIRREQLRHVFWLVLGVALLANSRPFEGLLFVIPIAAATLVWIFRRRRWLALTAVIALLAIVFTGMGYYNLRGTGSALKLPYMANFEQYHFVAPFFGMRLLPRPEYHHPQMSAFFEYWEGLPSRLAQTFPGARFLIVEKIKTYYKDPFAPWLPVVILGILFSLRSPRRRILALTLLFVSAGLLSVVWRPQYTYAAPLLVSLFGLAMLGLRCLGTMVIRGRRLGPVWVRGYVVVLLLYGIANMGENALKGLNATVVFPPPWNEARARLIDDLSKRGGEHLVFVQYAPRHNGHEEWVYNSPEIEKQKVIFARSISDTEDRRLMQHFAGRQVWILKPDAGYPLVLLPIPDSTQRPGR